MTTIPFRSYITASEPEKSLVKGYKRDVGRNDRGRITMRHKGGGHKRLYRDVDFSYDKKDIVARVLSVEYDPNRTGFIALVCYADGEKRYVLAPKELRVGDTFIVGENVPLKVGNRLPLGKIPVGTFVYNIEIKPQGGAKISRSAGNYAEVVALEGEYVSVKLPSTEVRKVLARSFASVGAVSNDENRLVNLGKAGRSRWLGIRPTVRGTAMNPVDHKHGGGEGRQGRGTRRAINYYGNAVGKGQKSRSPKKYSNRLLVSRRKVGKGKRAQ
jgi:large subunit ribosomal protein L2